MLLWYAKEENKEGEASIMQWSKQARHIAVTHRNWLWLHVLYIIVLTLTFVWWAVIGAFYFSTKIENDTLANILFIAYAAVVISLPAIVVHIRAAFTYNGKWQWRWSIYAQVLYYVLSAIAMVMIMLCIAYV